MVTIRDVAARAGVSLSTVSIVLNNQSKERKISEETSRRVMKAALDLHYHPNQTARKLRTLSADDMAIGLFWPVGQRMYLLGGIVGYIQKTLKQLNLNITLMIHPYRRGHLADELHTDKIYTYSAAIMGAIDDHDLYELERKTAPFPVVIINQNSSLAHLTVNHTEVGRLVGRTLLQENTGKIGAIYATHHRPGSTLRQIGIKDVLGQERWQYMTQFSATVDDGAAGGYHAVKAWMSEGVLPETIYVDDVGLALGALHCLYECGVPCPAKCSVLALDFGVSDLSEFALPSLSTIEVPLQHIIGEAVRLILTEKDRLSEKTMLMSFSPKVHLRRSLRQQPNSILI